MNFDLFELPIDLGKLKDSSLPTPEEIAYWEQRENRTFYIDYEIGRDYGGEQAMDLIELSKVIINMNIKEKDVENPKPIYIYVFSYGGDLSQAYSFCDLCISSKIPIVTINMGVAMSSGLLILLSGSKRYTFKHASALIHQGSAAMAGDASALEEAQKNYQKQLDQMKDYILERTKIDSKMFNKNKKKDWYLTAEEQVDYGVVDEIITTITDIL